MNFGRQAKIVLGLVKSTASKAIEWKESPREGAFQVSFKDYSVRLSVRPNRGTVQPDYVAEIISSDGDIIDVFTDVDLAGANDVKDDLEFQNVQWFATMRDLYSAARRQALGVDKALDAILNDLRSSTQER